MPPISVTKAQGSRCEAGCGAAERKSIDLLLMLVA